MWFFGPAKAQHARCLLHALRQNSKKWGRKSRRWHSETMALSRNSQVVCVRRCVSYYCAVYIVCVHLDWSERYGSLSSARSVIRVFIVRTKRLQFPQSGSARRSTSFIFCRYGHFILFFVYIGTFLPFLARTVGSQYLRCDFVFFFSQSTLVVISYFLRNVKSNQ